MNEEERDVGGEEEREDDQQFSHRVT
jgi:hypothetical protein